MVRNASTTCPIKTCAQKGDFFSRASQYMLKIFSKKSSKIQKRIKFQPPGM